MSMQKVSVMVPPLRPVPRGAIWVGQLASWLVGGDGRVRSGGPGWFGALRAKLAVDRDVRRDARSRADLVALACRYQTTQPEFAKELLAAASFDRDR